MKTTVQALKELYATLGGDLADVALIERIPEMIEALNSIAVAVPAPTVEDEGKVMTVGEDGAWGAETIPNPLPEVTSADAGKVLTVSDAGAWEAAAASGGGGISVDYWIRLIDITSASASININNITTGQVADFSEFERGKVYYAVLGPLSIGGSESATGEVVSFCVSGMKSVATRGKIVFAGAQYVYCCPDGLELEYNSYSHIWTIAGYNNIKKIAYSA